jgi:hypothetical protein
VRVEGTFNEFDRGWQPLGFIYSSLDAEGWCRIATTLWPAAEYELAAKVAVESEKALAKARSQTALATARRKTLVLAIGVTRYADAARFPTLAFAADDARALGAAYVERGLPPEHVVVLTDASATVAAVRSTIDAHLGRAREGDAVVVAFAGYGTRRPNGGAALALHEEGEGEALLGLDELAQRLAAIKGSRLVLLDASFDGFERSVTGSGRKLPEIAGGPKPNQDELAPLAASSGAAWIAAGGPSEPACAPEHLGSGLLTHHVLGAIRGFADRDRDGRLPAEELYQLVRSRVVAEAALLGATETPRAAGLERGLALALVPASRP